jgi:ribosome-binding protein aMBF1 (putative translation factor)
MPRQRSTGKQASARPTSVKSPTDIDREVGKRLRVLREEAGMSQTALGARSGVTFQQVQKYENGVNRLPINRLIEFCEALSVPASQVLDGLSTARQLKGPTTAPSAASGSRMHGIGSTRRGRQ